MRNLFTTVLVCLMLASLSACSTMVDPTAPQETNTTRTMNIIPDDWYGAAFTTPLYLGQEEAGVVTVTNDGMYLYVDVEIWNDCFTIDESNVAVAETLDGIPTNGNGSPKIGHFPYNADEPIPLSDFSDCIADLVISVHVAASCVGADGEIQDETGWGWGEEFTVSRSWAMYFNYQLRKGIPTPDPNCLTVQSFYPGADSYWDTYILDGLGDLEDAYRKGYDDGDPYRGWCVDLLHTMGSGTIYNCVEAYPSTDPENFPADDIRFDVDWNMINWILNNRDGYTVNQVQDAIWHLTNDLAVAGPALELAMAAMENPDYEPPPCGWFAVILRAGNNQLIMIEIDP